MSYSDSDSDSDYDGGDGGGTSTSVRRCLAKIGIDPAGPDLTRCASLTEEFTAIKKAYFKKILVVHPDKGGDAAEFRDVNSSWELIRKLYEDRKVSSFVTAAESTTQDRYDYDYSNGGGGSGGAARSASPSTTHMPWQYYYDAAEAEVPPYKVELARSGRSKCTQRTMSARRCFDEGPLIGKGEIRIGSLDAQSGSYGRWVHLKCWRVPSRIWMGLARADGGDGGGTLEMCVAALAGMNEVQFTGFNDLSQHDQRQVAAHAMDKSNWASLQGRRRVRAADLGTASSSSSGRGSSSSTGAGGASSGGGGGGGGSGSSRSHAAGASYATGSSSCSASHYSAGGSGYSTYGAAAPAAAAAAAPPPSGSALSLFEPEESVVAPSAARRGFYVVPRPGVNGARADFLKGKTIVMTGVFPEIGGGAGLNKGKDRLRSMCESFGARVTSSISGKTDMLIVGKEPGASKVGKASASPKCQLVSLADLTMSIQGEQQLESAAAPEIESFSEGYYGNGLHMRLGSGRAKAATKRLLAAVKKPKAAKADAAKPKPKAKSKAENKPKPKKRAPAKPKPKPKAKKSAASKKTAVGRKKGPAPKRSKKKATTTDIAPIS
ncbi:unnamed protein product [Ectocarpus fasciculatus]